MNILKLNTEISPHLCLRQVPQSIWTLGLSNKFTQFLLPNEEAHIAYLIQKEKEYIQKRKEYMFKLQQQVANTDFNLDEALIQFKSRHPELFL